MASSHSPSYAEHALEVEVGNANHAMEVEVGDANHAMEVEDAYEAPYLSQNPSSKSNISSSHFTVDINCS